MRPKGKLFALVAVFAAIAVVTASGAFTTVSAERTVTVDTAGDANALLALEGNSSGTGEYVTTENDQIVIDLSSPGNQGAEGVNLNATTSMSYMINVTNNGDQEVDFYVTVTDNSNAVDLVFYNGSTYTTSSNITGSTNGVQIGSGDQISIGLQIVTDDSSSTIGINETVTFHAEAT